VIGYDFQKWAIVGATRQIYIEAVESVAKGEMKAEEVVDVFEEHIDGFRNQVERLSVINEQHRKKLSYLLERLLDVKKDYDELFTI